MVSFVHKSIIYFKWCIFFNVQFVLLNMQIFTKLDFMSQGFNSLFSCNHLWNQYDNHYPMAMTQVDNLYKHTEHIEINFSCHNLSNIFIVIHENFYCNITHENNI